jgi:hypothetical protein
MDTIKKVVIGDTTEAIIKLLFDHKIAQESNEGAMNAQRRALEIKDLKGQIISFIKRQPNAKFSIEAPEHRINKSVKLSFTNYDEDQEDDDSIQYKVVVMDDYSSCRITQKSILGADVTLTLKAE